MDAEATEPKDGLLEEDIFVPISANAETMLRGLLDTGLFGLTLKDVMQRLIYERLRELVLKGWAEIPDPEAERDALLDTSVEELPLSVRLANILDSAGIKTIGDIVERRPSDFFKMNHFGKGTMRDLVDVLKSKGIEWG